MANVPKPDLNVLSQQERMVRDHLPNDRLRQARDEFKLLCKWDRTRYLPRLIEANFGFAREMAQKGMVGEVRQLVRATYSENPSQ